MARTWSNIAADLDVEISRATNQQQLLELSKRRNAITPFYRLPNEILERILLTIQTSDGISGGQNIITGYESILKFSQYDPEYTGSFWTTANLEWVDAMLVCRRLREVALASTSLWADVNMNHKSREWAELCLERANRHLLHLDARLPGVHPDTSPRFSDLFARSHSIRLRLYVFDLEWEMGDSLEGDAQIHSKIGNMKEELRICSANSHLSFLEIFSQIDSFPISIALLGGKRNCLTHLFLQEVELDWLNVPHMPLLRRLVLQFMMNDTHCRQLRSILVQTSNLEELYTFQLRINDRDIVDYTLDIPDISGDSVPLPRLAILHVNGDLIQVSQTLQLCLPPGNQGPDLDLYVDVSYSGDEIEHHHDPAASLAQAAVLARRVNTGVARHLPGPTSNKNMIDCSMQVSELSDQFKDIVLTYEHEPLSSSSEPFRHHPTRLLCPIGDNLTDLVSTAPQMSVKVPPGGSLDMYIPDILPAAQLQLLQISEVTLGMPVGQDPQSVSEATPTAHEEQLERLLLQRRLRYNAPIQRLIISNYDRSEPDIRLDLDLDLGLNLDEEELMLEHEIDQQMLKSVPLPSYTARDVFEKKWTAAGWVNEVQWRIEKASMMM